MPPPTHCLYVYAHHVQRTLPVCTPLLLFLCCTVHRCRATPPATCVRCLLLLYYCLLAYGSYLRLLYRYPLWFAYCRSLRIPATHACHALPTRLPAVLYAALPFHLPAACVAFATRFTGTDGITHTCTTLLLSCGSGWVAFTLPPPPRLFPHRTRAGCSPLRLYYFRRALPRAARLHTTLWFTLPPPARLLPGFFCRARIHGMRATTTTHYRAVLHACHRTFSVGLTATVCLPLPACCAFCATHAALFTHTLPTDSTTFPHHHCSCGPSHSSYAACLHCLSCCALFWFFTLHWFGSRARTRLDVLPPRSVTHTHARAHYTSVARTHSSFCLLLRCAAVPSRARTPPPAFLPSYTRFALGSPLHYLPPPGLFTHYTRWLPCRIHTCYYRTCTLLHLPHTPHTFPFLPLRLPAAHTRFTRFTYHGSLRTRSTFYHLLLHTTRSPHLALP